MLENRDLLLDVVTHDLVTDGYQLHISTDLEATAQRIKVRLKLFLGEWFLDLLAGVPYYQDILVKNPDITKVNSLIREAILTVPTVQRIITYQFTTNNADRTFTVNFKCSTSDGEIEDSLVLP